MIVLQVIMWLAFGAVSLLGIAYLFHAFGKEKESNNASVKYAGWFLQLIIVVCYLYSVYHFGKWLQDLWRQPHTAWGGRLRPWGRCPLISPEDFTSPFSITYRERTHIREKREGEEHTT